MHIINKEKEYYNHKCSVMSLIGDSANLIMGYEMTRRKRYGKDMSESKIIASI